VNPLRKVLEMLGPSPSKAQRQAAIDAARRERLRSEAGAREAEQIALRLRRETTNHYADDLVRQILRGHRANGA
jgi:hypothetical protein